MTSSNTHAGSAAKARRTAPAVHSLHSFGFTVPDLDVAARFYTTFGLDVRRGERHLDLHTNGHTHLWGRIWEAPVAPKKLRYVSFGCYDHEFDALAAHLHQRGYVRGAAEPMAPKGGIWLQHPDGFPVQVIAAEKTSPQAKGEPSPPKPVPPGRGAAASRSTAAKVTPRRLSHLLLFSPDVARASGFFSAALGLRNSDHSADVIVFMHGVHGSDHHLVAMAKSNAPGLHHLSWDVGSVDEVGSGMEQMLQAGYSGGWGVGRHVLGSNYFYYVRDPWGSYCEYSFDIDFVPKELEWTDRDHPLEDSLYVWGPPVPADFVTNHEGANEGGKSGSM